MSIGQPYAAMASICFCYVAYVYMARGRDGHVVRHRYVLFAVLAARRALLDHCDRTDYQRAWQSLADRPEDTRAPHAEAAMLAAALRRHRAGERLAQPEAVPAGVETTELSANVRWLQRVAKEIRTQHG
jgi:hypothetical protein